MTDELRAIDKIREKSVLERRSVFVPEWDMTFWFGKMTVAAMEAVDARRNEEAIMTNQERNLILLVNNAQKEDGTPMFRHGDIFHLRQEADFVVLQRVINFMFESAYVSVQRIADAKKKIEENPSSASD